MKKMQALLHPGLAGLQMLSAEEALQTDGGVGRFPDPPPPFPWWRIPIIAIINKKQPGGGGGRVHVR
jgi:hypothetical protein